MPTEITLEELARRVGGVVVGDGALRIRGMAGIEDAGPGELTFLANPRYASRLDFTKAAAVVVSRQSPRPPIPAIVVDDPNLAFAVLAEAFWRPAPPLRGVHPSAVIAETARLGTSVTVGPNAVVSDRAEIGEGTTLHALVFVGADARVGRDCVLYPNVSVRERCVLGARVIVHCGAVIGSDGFGYVSVDGAHRKIPQNGIVEIEDDVEIGANCTIDRARLGRTLVRRGTKLDNLVHLAHNVAVGEHVLMAAQVGVAGSVKIGDRAVIGGQAGIGGHLTIGEGAALTAQSGAGKDLPPGATYTGSPARPLIEQRRAEAALRKIPTLLEEIRDLRRRIEELERRAP